MIPDQDPSGEFFIKVVVASIGIMLSIATSFSVIWKFLVKRFIDQHDLDHAEIKHRLNALEQNDNITRPEFKELDRKLDKQTLNINTQFAQHSKETNDKLTEIYKLLLEMKK